MLTGSRYDVIECGVDDRGAERSPSATALPRKSATLPPLSAGRSRPGENHSPPAEFPVTLAAFCIVAADRRPVDDRRAEIGGRRHGRRGEHPRRGSIHPAGAVGSMHFSCEGCRVSTADEDVEFGLRGPPTPRGGAHPAGGSRPRRTAGARHRVCRDRDDVVVGRWFLVDCGECRRPWAYRTPEECGRCGGTELFAPITASTTESTRGAARSVRLPPLVHGTSPGPVALHGARMMTFHAPQTHRSAATRSSARPPNSRRSW